jgi:hypothetical protein
VRGGLTTARLLGSPDLASPFTPRVLPNESYGLGRVCSGYAHRDGCGTILNRYNPGPLCWLCSRTARYSEARHLLEAL